MSDLPSRLPARPSLEQLRKQAKERLARVRAADPSARLADAQLDLAREYGFDSWPKLVHHLEATGPLASAPRITAPMSRYLGARDVDRTVAFWREEEPISRPWGIRELVVLDPEANRLTFGQTFE